MRKILLLIMAIFLFAITPHKISYDYYISKIAFSNNYLIAGLENGDIVIKDFNSLKNIYTITLPKIEDFMGDKMAMPIYSLDIKNDKLLILSGGEDNSRKIFIFDIKNKKLNKILDIDEEIMKAKFYKDKILFAYLSDEISLYDLKTKKYLYRTQLGEYVFSTLAMYNSKVVIGDESGDIEIADINTGKKLKTINGYNKDQTLSLDIYKNLVINGSSDKRVGIYNIDTKKAIITLDSHFLPYGATITENKFAFQYDEKNDIALYNFNKDIKLLKGHTMPLNGMKFKDKNTLISYSSAEILIWRLNGKN